MISFGPVESVMQMALYKKQIRGFPNDMYSYISTVDFRMCIVLIDYDEFVIPPLCITTINN